MLGWKFDVSSETNGTSTMVTSPVESVPCCLSHEVLDHVMSTEIVGARRRRRPSSSPSMTSRRSLPTTSSACPTMSMINFSYLLVGLFLWSCSLHHVAGDTQLALLSGTLKTEQRAACDGQMLEIQCPVNTSVSIQFAQYGRHSVSPETGGGPILCPPGKAPSALTTSLEPVVMAKYNVTCFAKKALQTVVDKCQKQNSCQVYTTTTSFGEDPCPGIRKYLEVAYKCGPSIFQNKVLCQGERVTLSCPANFRLVIYSAEFGRTIAGELRCPQTRGVPREDCRASFATESVMQNCHGRRRCMLSADVGTFGAPCNPKSHMYLKVIYTCVPREVLKEPFQHRLEADEDGYSTSDETNPLANNNKIPGVDTAFNKTPETSYDVDEVKGSVPDWKVTPKSPAGVHEANSSEHQSGDQGKRTKEPPFTKYSERPETSMPQDAVPAVYDPKNGDNGRFGPAAKAATATSPFSPSSDRSSPTLTTKSYKTAGRGKNDLEDEFAKRHQQSTSSASSELVGDWIQTYQYLRENHETLVLYLSLSVAGGILLFCAALVTKLLVSRASSTSSSPTGPTGHGPNSSANLNSGPKRSNSRTHLRNSAISSGGGSLEDDQEDGMGMDMDGYELGGSSTSILQPLTGGHNVKAATITSPNKRIATLYSSPSSSATLLATSPSVGPHGAMAPMGNSTVMSVHANPLSNTSMPGHLPNHQQRQPTSAHHHVQTATALCPPAAFADNTRTGESGLDDSGVVCMGMDAQHQHQATPAGSYPALIGADSLEVVRYTQLLGTLRRQQNRHGGETQPPRSFNHRLNDDMHLYS